MTTVTPGATSRTTARGTPSEDERWFPFGPPRPEGGVPVFCLPYAGGGASVFRSWLGALGPGAQAVPVQLPGRESRHREAPAERLRDLVVALADVIAAHTGRPYALFGHSMGATIGYELAAELAARGRPAPRVLFVSAACAPHLRRLRADAHELDEAEFTANVTRLGGTSARLLDDPAFAEFYLPLMRADLRLVATYRRSATAHLLPRISAFGGTEDDAVEPEAVLAWRGYARQRFTSRLLPGDHFFLHPLREALTRAVAADLA